jgi:hypothetical protein
VRTIISLFIFVSLICSTVSGVEKSSESKVRIGILDLQGFGEALSMSKKASEDLKSIVQEIGFYDVFDQTAIEDILKKIDKKMPSHCDDPRCVIDLGNTSGLDRILYGSIDLNRKRIGTKLSIIDMRMRQTIESVSIEGEPGVSAESVLRAAVAKLHGNSTDTLKYSKYLGPEVHHEKQFLFSTASFIGAGLIWGIVNYMVDGSYQKLVADYPSNESLSGISSSADQIPLFARPAALANAYVAASDDAYGVLYNPAGMAWVTGPEAVLGYQYRFGLDNAAASYVNKATRDIGFGQALLYSGDREQLMTEMYFISAVAYKFSRLPSFIRPFSLGMNLKIASNRIKGEGEDSPSGASFGAGMDLGFLWELSDQIRYGLLLRDVPVVNRWKNMSTGQRYFENNATTLHMGGTFQAGYSTFLVAEGQLPIYKDQPWKMAGGIEQEVFRFFVLRAGIQKEIQSMIETPWKITGGFGLKIDSDPLAGRYMILDGSYEYNTLKVFDVINVSCRFGF